MQLAFTMTVGNRIFEVSTPIKDEEDGLNQLKKAETVSDAELVVTEYLSLPENPRERLTRKTIRVACGSIGARKKFPGRSIYKRGKWQLFESKVKGRHQGAE